jgi:hypothetical protein
MMAVVFDLAPDEVELARGLAEATYERYKGQPGHYRNLRRSHLVGKLGEVAVERWAQSHDIEPDAAYRNADRENEADLIVGDRGIAVKTWRPTTWPEMGRCVTPQQIGGIQKKPKAIVWVVVDDEVDPIRVEIPGWSTPAEVAATTLRATGPLYKPIMNHQIDADQLRDPAELVELLRS